MAIADLGTQQLLEYLAGGLIVELAYVSRLRLRWRAIKNFVNDIAMHISQTEITATVSVG